MEASRQGSNPATLPFGGRIGVFDQGSWSQYPQHLATGSKVNIVDRTAEGVFRVIEGELLYSESTTKQLVQIVETHSFGTILLLDGVIQLASYDQNLFHRSLVHFKDDDLRTDNGTADLSFLVFGGGDGFVAGQIKKYFSVRKLTLVDHDSELVNILATAPISRGIADQKALSDEKTIIIEADAFEFLASCDEEFDGIVIDLTDDWQSGEDCPQYRDFLARCIKRGIKASGKVYAHLGPTFWLQQPRSVYAERCRGSLARLLNLEDEVAMMHKCRYVPSFGEKWSFGCFWRSNKTQLR